MFMYEIIANYIFHIKNINKICFDDNQVFNMDNKHLESIGIYF